MSTPRRLATTAGTVAVTALLLVAAAAFLFLAVGPHVLGYRTQTMGGPGLAPGLRPGDVVVSRPVPAATLRAGDVVSYRSPLQSRPVRTELIGRVDRTPDGRVTITALGGAPETLDSGTAWRSVAVVPRLGSVTEALQAPALQRYGGWLALGVLLVAGLALARPEGEVSGATG